MSIKGIQDLPGFNPESYQDFIEILTNKWNLPPYFLDHAEQYFLRHWTASELHDNISGQGIVMNELAFMPMFKKNAVTIYNKERTNPTGRKFWLSFRAIRYPLGTIIKDDSRWGNLKAYVLIQPDNATIKS